MLIGSPLSPTSSMSPGSRPGDAHDEGVPSNLCILGCGYEGDASGRIMLPVERERHLSALGAQTAETLTKLTRRPSRNPQFGEGLRVSFVRVSQQLRASVKGTLGNHALCIRRVRALCAHDVVCAIASTGEPFAITCSHIATDV